MKDNKYNKNAESHKDMNEAHKKNAEQGSVGYKGSESKSHKETHEQDKRPQTKRGGRGCPNC